VRRVTMCLIAIGAACLGCDIGATPRRQASPSGPGAIGPAVDEAQELLSPHHAAPPQATPPRASDVAQELTPPAEAARAADGELERTKAEVGVGEKGKSIEHGLGRTAIKTYFVAQEIVAFRVQIPSAMSLYKAEHGQAPKTHDEFMAKIIKANQISLPELRQGHTYVYDPQTEELFVEHPKAQ